MTDRTPRPIDAHVVRELLDYDPETGVFIWRTKRKGSVKGRRAGFVSAIGYRQIRLAYGLHLAHRLAWLHVFGEWPKGHIDHINGIRGDDRIANLRDTTMSQNICNSKTRVDNTSGTKGVYYSNTFSRWVACVEADGRKRTRYFRSLDDAKEAVKRLRADMHGDYARD